MQDDDGRLVEAMALASCALVGKSPPCPQACEGCKAHARSALSAIEREGWKVVPVEPTEEMLDFSIHVNGENVPDSAMRFIWAQMVAASPKQG